MKQHPSNPYTREITDSGNLHDEFWIDNGYFTALLHEHAIQLHHFGISRNMGPFQLEASSRGDYLTIHFIAEGSMIMKEENTYTLGKGDVAVTTQEDHYRFLDNNGKQAVRWYFCIYPTLGASLFRSSGILADRTVFHPSAPQKLAVLLRSLHSMLLDQSVEIMMPISAVLYHFLIELNKQYKHVDNISSWEIMVSFLRRPPFNYTVADLAKKYGVSVRTFDRHFKSKFGKSPREYLAERRLSHASYLLTQGSCAISEIASICGYTDTSHFVHDFKQRVGVPPNKYRKMKTRLTSVFRHKIIFDMSGSISEEKSGSKNLSERRKQILYLIHQNSHITQRKLANSLGINVSAVEAHLLFLKREKLISRIGPPHGGYWEVIS